MVFPIYCDIVEGQKVDDFSIWPLWLPGYHHVFNAASLTRAMTSIVPYQIEDLFEANNVNLDTFTVNFPIYFYGQYLSEWPQLFYKSVEPSPNGPVCSGYMMGKIEGTKKDYHSHITAVTVAHNYRRMGIAERLCNSFKEVTESKTYRVLFVDLFVRMNNKGACKFYEKLGYSVYRRVVGYYGNELVTNRKNISDVDDALDMRISTIVDVNKQSVRKDGRKVLVLPNEINFN